MLVQLFTVIQYLLFFILPHLHHLILVSTPTFYYHFSSTQFFRHLWFPQIPCHPRLFRLYSTSHPPWRRRFKTWLIPQLFRPLAARFAMAWAFWSISKDDSWRKFVLVSGRTLLSRPREPHVARDPKVSQDQYGLGKSRGGKHSYRQSCTILHQK